MKRTTLTHVSSYSNSFPPLYKPYKTINQRSKHIIIYAQSTQENHTRVMTKLCRTNWNLRTSLLRIQNIKGYIHTLCVQTCEQASRAKRQRWLPRQTRGPVAEKQREGVASELAPSRAHRTKLTHTHTHTAKTNGIKNTDTQITKRSQLVGRRKATNYLNNNTACKYACANSSDCT